MIGNRQRLMMFAILMATALFAACNGGPETDSETHWMEQCSEDSDCDDELSCICNLCTTTCDDDCSQVAPTAVCQEEPTGCDETDESICVIECEDDGDCDADAVCDDDVCVADTDFNVDEPGDYDCDDGGAFYCEGFDCCPGDCYALTDRLVDVDGQCRLAAWEATYCISPAVLDEDELSAGGEAVDCFVDNDRGLALTTPTQTPGVTGGDDSALESCDEDEQQVVSGAEDYCEDSEELTPLEEHRTCDVHQDCASVYSDCSRSCVCTAVNVGYEDDYDALDLPCPVAGVCDYECMDSHAEVARCEDNTCEQVFVSYEEEDLIDRIPVDDEYSIGLPAYIDESGGLEGTGDDAEFSLESINGDLRLYYDAGTEFETFDELPETHLHDQSDDLDLTDPLEGRLYYDPGEHEAVVVVGEGEDFREIFFVEGQMTANPIPILGIFDTIELLEE